MILLDTHAWLWWAAGSKNLSARLLHRIESEREIAVSAISCWEIGMLTSKGRLSLDRDVRIWIKQAMALDRLRVVPITERIATEAGLLGGDFHGDPADRILVATARDLSAVLITKDERLRSFKKVPTFWV